MDDEESRKRDAIDEYREEKGRRAFERALSHINSATATPLECPDCKLGCGTDCPCFCHA